MLSILHHIYARDEYLSQYNYCIVLACDKKQRTRLQGLFVFNGGLHNVHLTSRVSVNMLMV